MAKIRGVKPELWTDENFVELSPFARLLWIGLWNHACDNGHLQDKSKQIKMRILPTDEVNCAELLREIEKQGLVVRADGWITIPNLPDHQKPHKHWYVICDKPGCIHPAGMTYGIGRTTCAKPDCRHGSTVEQPLTNQSAPVEHPLNNGGSTADVEGDVEIDGDGDGDNYSRDDAASSLPVVADASHEATGDSSPRADVLRICDYLADAIEENGSKRPAVTKAWRDEARRMLDIDGRDEPDIIRAIDWCQRGQTERATFWRSNVLSMAKLRAKFDQMRLQAAQESRPSQQQHQGRASQWLQLAADLGEPTAPTNVREIGPRR